MPQTPLISGLSSPVITAEEKKLFTQIKPYGFILFSRNIQSRAQVIELTASLRKNFGQDIYIFIDEEGGRVSRLTTSKIVDKGTFPNVYSFYQIYEKNGIEAAKKAVYDNYRAIGSELASLGINGNFAPVADLLHEEGHGVIGNRSFGRNPDIVIELCKSALEGLKAEGVDGCIKHIPGHGLATVDSHIALPIVKKDLAFLEQNDFRVFKELAQSCKFAMTAHVVYECLDKEKPVTLSQDAIKYIRDKIGFKGSIVSDCITMKALGGNVAQTAKDCTKAGCDVVIYAWCDLTVISKIAEFLGA
jgi:beta-glucosidase